MRAVWRYLRVHRWQRRVLTGLLALVCGGLTAWIASSHVQDYLLLRDLGSPNRIVRRRAVVLAVARGRESPRTVRRLNDALDAAGDEKFIAIVAALKDLREWDVPQRRDGHRDRLHALEAARNPDPGARLGFLDRLILCPRDSAPIRRALAAAARDREPAVRARSATLAARLKADDVLAALLADDDPNVAAAAALDAGVAGRAVHAPALRRLLRSPAGLEVRSAAAYALAQIDPDGSAEPLAALLAEADRNTDPNNWDKIHLRDRLLHAVTILGGPAARKAVLGVLASARSAGRKRPPMALVAAGKLHLAAAEPDVRAVLSEASPPRWRRELERLLAAVDAAERLRLPVRNEAFALCRRLWSWRWPVLSTKAARLLGRQAAADQPGRKDVPSAEQCVQVLRRAATYRYEPPATPAASRPAMRPATQLGTQPASRAAPRPATRPAGAPAAPRKEITTPTPSAAAAVALWQLNAKLAEEFVRNSAAEHVTLPGDYIAWHLATTGEARAFQLALRMIPPPGAPPEQRVYNDNERSAGALLAAMAARTADQRTQAVERVRSRLTGGRFGGEDSFLVRGAYRCALLILGDRAQHDAVLGLLQTGQFSQRRAIAALTLAGSRDGLDWLLWNRQVTDEDVAFLLVDEQLREVLEACAPQLPRVDDAASTDLRRWQVRILKHTYAVRRADIRPRPPWQP